MTINRIIRGMAGFFVLLSLTLAYLHSTNWLWFTAFVGLNLFQSSITGWCPAITILKRIGFKE